MPNHVTRAGSTSPSGAVVVGRNSAFLLGSSLVARLAALVTTIIVVRRLTTQDFAVVVLAQAAVAYLAIALDFGLTLAGIGEVARDRTRAPFTMGSVVVTRVAIAVVGLVVMFLSALALHLSPQTSLVLLLFAISTSLAVFDLSWILQGIEDMKPRAFVLAGTAILNLVFVAVLLQADPNPVLVPLAQILASTALIAVAASIVIRRVGMPLWAGSRSLGVLVGTAIPLGVGSFMAQIYYNFDLLLLGAMRPPSEVAAYGAVYKIILGLLMLAGTYGVVFLPRYAAAQARADGSIEKNVRRNMRLLASFAVPVAVGGTVFAKPIVDLLFGQAYEPGAQPLAILLWSVVVAFVSSTLVYALVATGRGWLVTTAAATAAAVNVALNLALIPTFGMTGAAVSTVAAELVVLLLVLVRGGLVSWATPIDLARIVPAAAAMALALVTTVAMSPVLALVGGMAAYLIVALIVGVWTREDRGLARDVIVYLLRRQADG